MESGSLPAIPVPHAIHKIMIRALAVLLVVFALHARPCGAQATSPPVDARRDFQEISSTDVSTKQPNPHSNSAAGASSGEDSAAENELLEAANKSRALAGVPPLRSNESLREAARIHAQRMIASDRLEHQLPGELPLLRRIAEVGAPNGTANGDPKIDRAGENIAYADCAPNVNAALMRSAPHRENLIDHTFNLAGFAAIWSNGKLYVVQDFAREVPSYSARESDVLVSRAVDQMRHQTGLSELVQLTPPKLDEAACSLAREGRPNAHLLATAYENRKIITYTQSRPEILPNAALPLLRDPGIRQFAVGACYARNATYPTGMYWVAILLY
jgi:uncharacterized protein YkwD